MIKYKKINITENFRKQFYVFPKWLKKCNISVHAKMLYMLLRDRTELSIKNEWYDNENMVFVYYKMTEIEDDLDCGQEKARKVFSELLNENLCYKQRQGRGLPDRIYVLEPTDEYLENLIMKKSENESETTNQKDNDNIIDDEVQDELRDEVEKENILVKNFEEKNDNENINDELYVYNEDDISKKDLRNVGNYKTLENRESRPSKIKSLDPRKSIPNKTNNNKTNNNKTNNNNIIINQNIIKQLKHIGLEEKDIVVVASEMQNFSRTDNDLKRYLNDMKNKNIHNVTGYLVSCIRNNYRNVAIKKLRTNNPDPEINKICKIIEQRQIEMLKKYQE